MDPDFFKFHQVRSMRKDDNFLKVRDTIENEGDIPWVKIKEILLYSFKEYVWKSYAIRDNCFLKQVEFVFDRMKKPRKMLKNW